jgi:hypothetical protein
MSCNNQQRMITIIYLSVDKLMEQSQKIGATHGFDANSVFCPSNVSSQFKQMLLLSLYQGNPTIIYQKLGPDETWHWLDTAADDSRATIPHTSSAQPCNKLFESIHINISKDCWNVIPTRKKNGCTTSSIAHTSNGCSPVSATVQQLLAELTSQPAQAAAFTLTPG